MTLLTLFLAVLFGGSSAKTDATVAKAPVKAKAACCCDCPPNPLCPASPVCEK